MPDEFQFDETDWPILVIKAPPDVNDAAFAAYLKKFDAILQKGVRYGIIMDASQTKMMSAQQRLEMSNYLRSNRERLGQYCVGTAFVITNKVVKGMLSAIMMFTPLPYDHKVVGDAASARDWVRQQLAKEGK